MQIEAEWAKPQDEWARKRLLVVRLVAQHELTVAQIMKVVSGHLKPATTGHFKTGHF